MKIFIIIIRFLFFPIKIINNLIYGTPPPNIAAYSWYTPKDYGLMVQNSKDDPENLIPTFELWNQNAKVELQKMRNKNWMVFKVRIKYNELNKWLKNNRLTNTVYNRQEYMNYRLSKFLKNPAV